MDFAGFRFMRRAVILAALALVVATGCSDSTPAQPTPSIDLTGRWIGDLTVLQMPVRMTWTLSHTNTTTVNGPVLLSLSSGTVVMNGFLTGTLSGSTLTYTITVGAGGIPAQPACAGQVGGTMLATIGAVSTLTGTSAVTGSNCTPPFPGGTPSLTRQ
jgi:hypothetical protein